MENIGYLLSYGWQTALIRAPITTLAHVTFSALWGYPLARKKLKKKNSTLLLWLGFWRDVLLRAAGSDAPLTNVDRIPEIEALASELKRQS